MAKIKDSLKMHEGHNIEDDGIAIWCYTCKDLVNDPQHRAKAIERVQEGLRNL